MPEYQKIPCLKQTWYVKFKWLQRTWTLNNLISTWTFNHLAKPFGKVIELCCEYLSYLSAWCIDCVLSFYHYYFLYTLSISLSLSIYYILYYILYIYIHIYIIFPRLNPFGLGVNRERWWFEHSVSWLQVCLFPGPGYFHSGDGVVWLWHWRSWLISEAPLKFHLSSKIQNQNS